MAAAYAAADGKPLHDLRGHQYHVQSVAFHPDGKSLVSGDLHGIVKQWDLATGKPLRELKAARLYKKIREYKQGGVRVMQ